MYADSHPVPCEEGDIIFPKIRMCITACEGWMEENDLGEDDLDYFFRVLVSPTTPLRVLDKGKEIHAYPDLAVSLFRSYEKVNGINVADIQYLVDKDKINWELTKPTIKSFLEID